MKGQGRLLSVRDKVLQEVVALKEPVCLTLGSGNGSGASNSPEVLGIYSTPSVPHI